MQSKLISGLLIAGLITPIQAQEANETITVTASRLELPITATLNDVIVIDAEEIVAASATTLFDLLQSKSGIDWVRKGGPGQEISMYVRGSGTNQLLVLLDGVEIGSATLGYKALADINLAQVERIEIVKGPRAAIWGSKAIGGVLQIFSRDEQAVRLSMGLGSFNERTINVATGLQQDDLSISISADSLRSDGIDARFDGDPDEDGIERDNLNLTAKYKTSDNAELSLRYVTTEGLTQYDSFFGDDTLIVDNDMLALNYDFKGANNNHLIQLARQSDSSVTQDDGSTLFVFETISESLKYLFNTKQSDNWTIGTSLEYLNEDVSNSSTTYNSSDRTTTSGHIYSHYQTGIWVNEFAVRYTDVEDLESNTSVHAGIGYRHSEQQLISLNYGEGFKVPTFNDLYFPFGGNPDLEHELSENLEIVYKQWFDSGSLSLSIYDNDITNLIQFIPDENGNFNATNIGKANLRGADLTYTWQTADLSHQFSAQYVDAKDIATDTALQLRANLELGYQLNGNILDNLTYQLSLQHIGERPDIDYQTFVPIDLNSFTQLNLHLGYELDNNWQIRLAVRDLLDEEGQYVSGYRAAGRTIRLTVLYQGNH